MYFSRGVTVDPEYASLIRKLVDSRETLEATYLTGPVIISMLNFCLELCVRRGKRDGQQGCIMVYKQRARH